MTNSKPESFAAERERLQILMQSYAGRDMKRFLTLDHQVYQDGALPARTKELLGLTASLVLRCDDCIHFHLSQCHQQGITTEELVEALSVGLVVGGSITIPQIRRALEQWDSLTKTPSLPA